MKCFLVNLNIHIQWPSLLGHLGYGRVDERCYGFPIIFFLFIHVMVIEINRKIEQSKRIRPTIWIYFGKFWREEKKPTLDAVDIYKLKWWEKCENMACIHWTKFNFHLRRKISTCYSRPHQVKICGVAKYLLYCFWKLCDESGWRDGSLFWYSETRKFILSDA